MSAIEPDKWYLAIVCDKCGRTMVSQDEADEDLWLPRAMNLTCYICGHAAFYGRERTQRLQGRRMR